MGNRAVITTKDNHPNSLGVYLHWNGGYSSVEAFLKYCKLKQYRSPESDNYGWVNLVTTISNWMGGGLSVGIDRIINLDCNNGDNGVYYIQDWEIVGREYNNNCEQKDYGIVDFLIAIDEKQPEGIRIGASNIIATVTGNVEQMENPKVLDKLLNVKGV